MKRIKIAAVLLVIIIIYSISSLFILRHKNELLKAHIEQLQQVYEVGNKEEALKLAEELNGYWHEYEKSVTMLIHDEALSGINVSIAKILPFIRNDNDELIAEINSVYQQIDRIYEEEFPYWYNIL